MMVKEKRTLKSILVRTMCTCLLFVIPLKFVHYHLNFNATGSKWLKSRNKSIQQFPSFEY